MSLFMCVESLIGCPLPPSRPGSFLFPRCFPANRTSFRPDELWDGDCPSSILTMDSLLTSLGKHPIGGIFDPPCKKRGGGWGIRMGTEGNTSIARRHWAGWFPLALTKLSVRGVNRKLLIFYQVSYVCSSEREDLGKVGEPNTCNTVLLVQGNLAPWDCCSPPSSLPQAGVCRLRAGFLWPLPSCCFSLSTWVWMCCGLMELEGESGQRRWLGTPQRPFFFLGNHSDLCCHQASLSTCALLQRRGFIPAHPGGPL